jgi:hypothetical protein
MATKIKTDSSKRNDKFEFAAGALKIAREARTGIPAIVGLQRALSTGGVAAQRREIDRLAKKYGDRHPRVIDAQTRVARLQAQQALFDRGLDGLDRAVETLTVENAFHGYVVDADGAPAVKYTVCVSRANQAQDERGASTNDDGYFRIDLGDGKTGPVAGPGARPFVDNSVLMSRLGRFAPGFEASMAEAAGSGTDASEARSRKRAATGAPTGAAKAAAYGTNDTTVEWRVRILDPDGKPVQTDEIPLRLEPGRSIFRYYALS